MVAILFICFGFALWHGMIPSIAPKNSASLYLLLGLYSTLHTRTHIWDGFGLPASIIEILLTVIAGMMAFLFVLKGKLRKREDRRHEWLLPRLLAIPPILWTLLHTFRVPLPAAGLEWIVMLEALIFTAMVFRSHQTSIPAQDSVADVTPSMRIAHSGVQVLNHSFKNKLLTMEMAIGTLKSKLADPGPVELEIGLIQQSIDHLKQMVNRLRDRTKDIVLHEEAVKLDNLLHTILAELKPSLPAHIDIRLRGSLSAVLVCDGTHLKEVFLNILRNSMEAFGCNNGHIEIYLPPPLPGQWLTICVEDNGPGIPSGSLGRVFEPYFTTKAGKNNYGLGLSYCYNVLRTSSGSIKINSSVGKGTTVILSFPPKKVLVYPASLQK